MCCMCQSFFFIVFMVRELCVGSWRIGILWYSNWNVVVNSTIILGGFEPLDSQVIWIYSAHKQCLCYSIYCSVCETVHISISTSRFRSNNPYVMLWYCYPSHYYVKGFISEADLLGTWGVITAVLIEAKYDLKRRMVWIFRWWYNWKQHYKQVT